MKTSQMLDMALLAAQHVLRPAPPQPPVAVPLPTGPIHTPDGKYELRDEALFFTEVRKITGPLKQAQVDTIKALLKAGNHLTTSRLAYEFATGWWEARLSPIAEWGKGKGRKYGVKGKYGQIPYGRGLVQLTWDRNYEWADKALDLGGSLLRNFDRALEPDIAVRIMILGMDTGAFTGKALRHYFTGEFGTYEQAVGARRIINGTDKAEKIAKLFLAFQAALKLAGWRD